METLLLGLNLISTQNCRSAMSMIGLVRYQAAAAAACSRLEIAPNGRAPRLPDVMDVARASSEAKMMDRTPLPPRSAPLISF